MKKKYVILLGAMLLMASCSAIWILFFEESFNVTIGSTPNFQFTHTIEDVVLDATEGDVNETQILTITNTNGAKLMRIFYNITQTDVADDGCDDYLEDIQVWFLNGLSQPLGNGASWSLPSGDTEMPIVAKAKYGSCPQSVDVEFIIEEA